jgi:hypothetical protein
MTPATISMRALEGSLSTIHQEQDEVGIFTLNK